MSDRCVFIQSSQAFIILLGVAFLAGCGGYSGTSPSQVADIQATSTAVNGHTHTVKVSASDQLHPADTSYTSSTDAGHNHTVTLSTYQLQLIAGGGSVTVTSTSSTVTGNHRHDFTFQGKK